MSNLTNCGYFFIRMPKEPNPEPYQGGASANTDKLL